MENKKTVLITGATGLLGSYLLKVFLENGHKVYALARSKNKKKAKERVEDVLKFWNTRVLNENSNTLTIIESDITKESLGLDNKSKDLLKKEVEEIFHCAAITEFNYSLEDIRKINVVATKNILELGLIWKKEGNFKKVNHVSTIFIYGDYEGIFTENHLDVGQQFNNTYGQSKFEAEKLVEEYRKNGLWVDIFRPAIVIGESATGKITSFSRAFYQAIRSWNLEIFDYYPGKSNYFFDITFVDELCKSIFLISSNSTVRNRNYHPFGSSRISLEKTIEFSSEFLGFKKPKIISTEDFLNTNPTFTQKKILQYNFFFKDSDTKLNSQITNDLLKKYNFEFSTFNKNLFFNLLDYAVKGGFLFKK